MPQEALEAAPSKRGERFFINVLWNWAHVGITLFSAVILSRYIIRKLGPEGYGLWQLSYSMIGYYGLLDLGFRSAVVYYTARHRAREERQALNELVTTLLVYFSVIGAVLIGVSWFLSGHADKLFPVSARYQDAFSKLVFMIGISLASGLVFNVFSGFVEGFQRFDLANQIRIISFVVRYFGCAVLLYLGYGLVAMGLIALIAQMLLNVLYVVIARRIFPPLHFSFSLVKIAVWKQTAAYGVNAFVASIANTSLEQSPSMVIGRMQGAASVGYFNLPLRILMYAADAVSRVGIVASAQAAEFSAKGRLEAVARLGIYANRYCFTLYMPLAMLVLVYGHELIQLWVGTEYVIHSAPLLPVMLIGTAFTTAGQFTSSSLLFGMGKHRDYAYFLLAEAAANIAGLILVIPRYGLMGAAIVAVSLMTLVRGLITPWLVCRLLHFSYIVYMRSIFLRPLLTALPVVTLLYWLKWHWWPGATWMQLFAVSAITTVLYYGAAYFTCLEDEHKALLRDSVSKIWHRMLPPRSSL